MIKIGLVVLIFLSDANYRDCSDVFKHSVNDLVVAIMEAPVGFEDSEQRLRTFQRIYVNLFFKLFLESVSNILREFLDIFQRLVDELRAVQLLLPERLLKRMQHSESGIF